ncbi:hypothetical protein V3N99_16140 [Dermatophilaceae bacterium Soc4.6]
MSAALWTSPGASAPGAFDDADNFRVHDVFAMRATLGRMPVVLDCGDSDPFIRADHAFVDGFTTPPGTQYAPGGHPTDYWRRTAPSLLRFASAHLA